MLADLLTAKQKIDLQRKLLWQTRKSRDLWRQRARDAEHQLALIHRERRKYRGRVARETAE